MKDLASRQQVEAFLEDLYSTLGHLGGEKRAFGPVSGQILKCIADPSIADSEAYRLRISRNLRLQRDSLLRIGAETARLYFQFQLILPEAASSLDCGPPIYIPPGPERERGQLDRAGTCCLSTWHL